MHREHDLSSLQSQAHALMETDPDHAAALYYQVIDGYRSVGNERAELEATHWLMQTLNHFAARYDEALKIGLRAILKARGPQFNDFTTRICLQEDLISSYLGVDPEGYESEIRDLLAYMRGEISDAMQCGFCLRYRSFDLEMWLENFAAAQEIALESLGKSENGWYGRWHRTGYLGELCSIVCLSGLGQEQMLDWARDYEELSRLQNRESHGAVAAIYLAVGHLARGENDDAKKALRRARARFKTNSGDFEDFYNGARAYAKLDDKSSQIPALCDAELAILAGKTAPARTARVHRYKCEALAHLGILDAKTLQTARECAAKLRAPQNEWRRLEKLTANQQ